MLIQTQGLTKTYRKGNFTLQPIDLQLYAGEVIGLVGENGNGKTTLLRMLAGLLARDGGSLTYAFAETEDWHRIKPEIGYISQRISRWNGTVYENLHFHAGLRGLLGQENIDFVDYIIRELGLWEYRHLDWRELSGGYQMRFELARTLVKRPKVLILDEPLANLDVKAQTTFLSDLRRIQAEQEQPMGIMLSSQHLYKIEEVSDSIIFLRNGKCLYNGPIESLSESSEYNVYELVVKDPDQLPEAWLAQMQDGKMIREGKTLLFYTPKSLTPDRFLKNLVEAGIDPISYRNISNSTRQLFEQP